MAPLADNSYGPPQGVPIPAHDLRSNGNAGSNGNISYYESGNNVTQLYGANPGPGWSSRKHFIFHRLREHFDRYYYNIYISYVYIIEIHIYTPCI